MNDDDIMVVKPVEAGLIFCYGRLVMHLESHGVLSAVDLADDLEGSLGLLPEDSRDIVSALASGLRPMSASKFGVIIGGKDDGSGDA